jgi:hypothetical protein
MRRNLWWRQTMWKKKKIFIHSFACISILNFIFTIIGKLDIYLFISQSDIVRINELSLWYWKYWYLWNHNILKFTSDKNKNIRSWHTLSQVLTYIITSLDIHYHKSWLPLSQVLTYIITSLDIHYHKSWHTSGFSKWAGTRYFYLPEIVYSTGRNYWTPQN